MRYYVAREIDGIITVQRLATLADAKKHSSALYSNGALGFPLTVAAVDTEAAKDKASRCYNRKLTCAQARNPRVK